MLQDEQLRVTCLDIATRGGGNADQILAAAKRFYEFIKGNPQPPASEKSE